MLVLAATVVALISPLLFGGKLSRYAEVRFRAWWLVAGALIAQILIIEIFPHANRVVLDGVHLLTYVAAGVFVALNWRVPGLLVIALGGFLNGLTIALNGGTLPASASAVRTAGLDDRAGEFTNSAPLAHPVLSWLGDVFAWPQPLPLANVFSVGDILIVLGALYGAHRITGSRLIPRAWRHSDERERHVESALTPLSPELPEVS